MKKLVPAIIVITALLLAVGLLGKYVEHPFAPGGTITQLVVIEESKDQTADQGSVLLGKTSQTARKASKWKLEDKDHLPVNLKPLVNQAPPKTLPWLIIDKKAKVVWSGALPATEVKFAELVKQQGGL